MATLVRPGDVFVLPILGDNGETKERFCVLLDSYPTLHAADVVSLVFGCSNTKAGARADDVVRIEPEPAVVLRQLGLLNATTFHLEDVRLYDARSPRFDLKRRRGRCPPGTFLLLRALWERRLAMPEPIELLPDRPRDEAVVAAAAWQAGDGER